MENDEGEGKEIKRLIENRPADATGLEAKKPYN